MVKNNVLLLLHSSNRHVEELERFKTKKYYHRVTDPVCLVAVQWLKRCDGVLPRGKEGKRGYDWDFQMG